MIRQAKKARERLISIFTEIAEERKHSVCSTRGCLTVLQNTEEPGLLHVLLEMGATNLHGKLLGVFFAAHTNAAGTMFWLFVNLMTHPEKLYDLVTDTLFLTAQRKSARRTAQATGRLWRTVRCNSSVKNALPDWYNLQPCM